MNKHRYYQAQPITVSIFARKVSDGRHPRWGLKIVREEQIIFASEHYSIHFATVEAAEQFALWVYFYLWNREALPSSSHLEWKGDLLDDCHLHCQDFHAHAEWLYGPKKKGGAWYASVDYQGELIFHSADWAYQLRSGKAARWLCEAIVLGVDSEQSAADS